MKLKSKAFFRIILFIGIIYSLAGCKSSKNVISTSGTLASKSQKELMTDIIDSELKYNTLSGKVSVGLSAVGSQSELKTHSYIKIQRDKAIQISIRLPLINKEIMRLDVTPDSVILIDRNNRKYGVEYIDQLNKNNAIDINYYNLQALLTNSLFAPGKTEVTQNDYKDFRFTKKATSYELQANGKSDVKYGFNIAPNDRITSTSISKSNATESVLWNYSGFINESGKIYPTNHEVIVAINNRKIRLTISYPSLDIDKDISIDSSLPGKYEKVPIKNIIKDYFK